MSNTLTLTTPANPPAITKLRIAGVTGLDEDAKKIVVYIQATSNGGLSYQTYALNVQNGLCDRLQINGSPSSYSDAFTVDTLRSGAGVATAFDDLFTDYKATGRNGALSRLQTIGALPAGVVA